MGDVESWGRRRLNGLINVKHGYPFKSEHFADRGDFVVLTPGNFWEAGGFKSQPGKEKFYSSSFPRDYLLEKDDLIVAMTEQAEGLLGSMAIVPEENRYLLNQRIGKVTATANDVSLDFLYHAFKTRVVREQLSNTASGSKVRHTSPERICDVSIPLPPITEQKKIADFLSAIDAKIDLNTHMNAELEAMAKTIYDYWFVQFDFPDVHGRPYKSNGGAMVWNDILKRDIPAGWEARGLSDLVPVSTAIVDPASEPGRLFKHLSIPGYDASGSFVAESGSDIGSNKFSVTAFDLLVSKLNPRFNRVFADTDHDALICSTEFVVWRCEASAAQAFLHSIATHPRFIAHCTRSATGTSNSHKRVNPQVMMRFQVPHTTQQANAFGALVAPILEERIRGSRENRELTQLRDWLLPLLMNGQVRVA